MTLYWIEKFNGASFRIRWTLNQIIPRLICIKGDIFTAFSSIHRHRFIFHLMEWKRKWLFFILCGKIFLYIRIIRIKLVGYFSFILTFLLVKNLFVNLCLSSSAMRQFFFSLRCSFHIEIHIIGLPSINMENVRFDLGKQQKQFCMQHCNWKFNEK